MGDEVDECYEFHPAEDGVFVARRCRCPPKAMGDTTQLGYLHEGRLLRRRRSVSLHADQQERPADILLRGCVKNSLMGHKFGYC